MLHFKINKFLSLPPKSNVQKTSRIYTSEPYRTGDETLSKVTRGSIATDVYKTGFTIAHRLCSVNAPSELHFNPFKRHHRSDLLTRVNQSCSPIFTRKPYRYILLLYPETRDFKCRTYRYLSIKQQTILKCGTPVVKILASNTSCIPHLHNEVQATTQPPTIRVCVL